ncbi:WD40 repeat-like protein [Pseudovirgaria hyperparasitica]|uniref:WD40 repeat-like protein n=1 Tax=Pseudovirgaria hyperparasitica TaxID=470096 RepID=A0A6A6WLS1_9PEZI|nr:WD40 repeat-like protein [Pseudovirgaria hyperparasitica]KAF2763141.1 WD40 repeat-like protein [Pseudovirgaria hyperparasitica]
MANVHEWIDGTAHDTALGYFKFESYLQRTPPPSAQPKGSHPSQEIEEGFYDVKFYPFGPYPIFAATGRRLTIVVSINTENNGTEMLRQWENPKDVEGKFDSNSLTWSKDIDTGDPLLCIAGTGGDIRIYNVITGALVQTLGNHGGSVNDLITSPLDPRIIASASQDHSIHIWNLDKRARNSPSQVVLGGPHTDGVLTIDFHDSGKFLLSGGHDTKVCMWKLPSVDAEKPNRARGQNVHFPVFESTEIHAGYVDCQSVKFHHDLILSKCSVDQPKDAKKADRSDNCIVLWRIVDFQSDRDDPQLPPFVRPDNPEFVKTTINYTRSVWGRGFERLALFKLRNCGLFYNRFGLFNQADMHPILAMGDEESHYYFWDLQRIEEDLKDGLAGRQDRAKAGLLTGDTYNKIECHYKLNCPNRKAYLHNRAISFSNDGMTAVGAGALGNECMNTIFRRHAKAHGKKKKKTGSASQTASKSSR